MPRINITTGIIITLTILAVGGNYYAFRNAEPQEGITLGAPSAQYLRTIIPTDDSTYDLGTNSVRWADGYFDNLVSRTTSFEELTITDIDVTNATATNATTTNLTIDSLSSALIQVDANGKVGEYAGTSCTNQFTRALSALGIATCETVSLTTDVTGTMPIANGGTNATSFGTSNGVVYYNGTSLVNDADFTFDGSVFTVGTGSANATSTIDGSLHINHNLQVDGAGIVTSITASGDASFGGFDIRDIATTTSNYFEASSGTVGAPSYTFTGDFDTGMWRSGADTLNFSTAGSERLRIDSSGNIGVGVTSPGVRLDIASTDTTVARFDHTDGATIWTEYENNAADYFIGYGSQGFLLSPDTSTVDLVVDSSGNVGIGTTSPTIKLDVESGATNTVARFSSTDAGANITLTDSVGSSAIEQNSASLLIKADASGVVASSDIRFQVDGSSRMTIDANGDVGIGDTSPASLLTVGSGDLFQVSSSGIIVAIAGLSGATGTYDFGGVTSFEIPNGTAPVVDAIGEFAFDTTDNQLLVATSTNATYPAVIRTDNQRLFAFTLASTSPEFISGGVIPIPSERDGYVIHEFSCYVDGGTSIVVNISDGTNDTETITCATTNTTDTDVSQNNVVTAGELMEVQIGTITGSPDYLTFSAYGAFTRE